MKPESKDDCKTYLNDAIKALGVKGGIIILQTDEGIEIAQIGLSQGEILENLCLAIYYAKKIELDEQYKIDQSPLN